MHVKRINVNQITLNLHEYPQNGPALILLHFGRATATVWHGLLPFLTERYHVIIPELRGHGHSDKPADGYTVDTMADDIGALMDALAIPQAHLVGSSLGAEVALSLAARYPDRVLSLACEGAFQNTFGPHSEHGELSPAAIEAKKAEMRAARAQIVHPTFDSAAALCAAMQAQWEGAGLWNEHLAAAVAYDCGETPDGRFARLSPPWVTDAYLEDYWDARFERLWARVTCPVLFLLTSGESEAAGLQESVAWFRSLVKESQVTLIEGAHHAVVLLTHPEAVAQAVLAFQRDCGIRV